ncbi:TIGR02391 family protein [Chryseobacterium shandongense]|uniref:TIGR02391 family protein n=1 Tax=Chryseobacterium shandongense TaxID=1493872 RepID=A0ABN5S3Z8_9FLAO|nr:TIGR02391 family protein [Chryseobacterium shandongense]AZA95635.1 TIGR02391 family protein [Chryseobacterium shandongense]
MTKSFDDITLRNISDIIANMLTHSKITEHLTGAGISESHSGTNKTDRLFYALKERQIQDKCGNHVLAFVMRLLNPKRYDSEEEFEKDRTMINEKLVYDGIEIDKTGQPRQVNKARTISEAKSRSLKIKDKVHGIGVHSEILPYCEAEWLKENYFHAILEITKSVAQRLRQKSGYSSDGADLIDDCFALGKDKKPMLAFNTLSNPSEESEHKGFGNFCKGFFSMYRNPKAHNPKILEDTQLSQMTEVLVVATIIHNKLDNTYRTGFK